MSFSDRLQTLVALSGLAIDNRPSPVVVTNVAALLQKTFPPGEIRQRTRSPKRGEKIDPLNLIEWIEEQGYEPEAKVSRHERPGLNVLNALSEETAVQVAAQMKKTKHPGDVTIPSIHWGGNWGYDIPKEQMIFARRLVEEGLILFTAIPRIT
jgi:poly-gamma-glutamate capsule biosynthesis protein CapA/YwtB (metallophosphatase superfamily)